MNNPKDLLFPGDKAKVSKDGCRYVTMGSAKNVWDWVHSVIAWNELQKKREKK